MPEKTPSPRKSSGKRDRGSLAEYDRKRDFAVTPEPAGEVAARAGWSYLVQKHAASRLHYDLRLELDGVLKSWAVPKGPDLRPGEKHLAVHVEDHPVEYGTFEGIIPRGEYGGGTVLLWDRGGWAPLDRNGERPEDDEKAAQMAREGLRKGRLHFRLLGEKLQGAWKLVRMHGKASDGGKNWLLIKSDDEAARASGPHVTEARPESVATGRTLEEIAADPDRVWSSRDGERAARPGEAARPPAATTARPTTPLPPPDLPDLDALPKVRKAALPKELPTPQLATRVADAPTGDLWLHEIKHDGYRLLARVDRRGKSPDVRLVTRGGEDWTDKFRPIAAALEALPVEAALLDGEAVAVAPDGTSDFGRLQRALAEGREGELAFYAFDLLHLDGRDLAAAPLDRRKEVLAALLAPYAERHEGGGVLRYSDHLEGRGRDFHRQACRLRLEGIVSKRRDRPYRPGRGADWVKAKCSERQELVIGGWTDPSGSRTGFGSLVLGVYPAPGEEGAGSGKLVYAGRVGTGFDGATLHSLSKRLAALATGEPPFLDPKTAKKAARRVHWVEPRLVCEVEFTEWTEDGRLRHPSFQGLREDKAPEDVVREAPLPEDGTPQATDDTPLAPEIRKEAGMSRSASKKSGAKKKGKDRVEVAGISISSPDRVVFPEQGLTKRQIAEYYEAVADRILPHVEDRPLSLVRCPEGRTECFYQKHVDKSFPAAVGRVEIEEKEGKARTYAMANDVAGLVGLVQMGVLELHPWGSRRDRLERPDLLTFDLDPDPGAGYETVVDGARALRDLLDHLELTSFVKTSGGKGLHVVLPIDRRTGWDAARAFTRGVAEALAQADPDRFLAQASKEKRKGKVFVDYLRNARGATSVAAYSTRARAGAPVSMPLRWDEIGTTGPADYTVENASRRIASQKSDPWDGIYRVRQSLTRKVFEQLGIEAPKG